jgi:RNA polymerase sigma-70 factor (ECF subfamily)
MDAFILDRERGGSMSVLARVRRGDGEAFTELVEAYDADLARLCFVICGDAELARDAAQAAWQRLWHAPPRLRDETRLRSWLLSVAANEARQAIRRGRRGAVLESASEPPRPEPSPDQRIERLDLVRVLDGLSAGERQLLGLRYLLEMPSAEIATLLGITPEGVRSRLHRLLARLRTELDR